MSIVGVFDSGIGGLTVARQIATVYPNADLLYLGDTARLPYGAKSPDTVTRYALRCVEFLVDEGAQIVVVACNTASACALPALRARWPELPVLGVVGPGSRAALAASRSGVIGILGTQGTIASGSYPAAITELEPTATVTGLACPLLVPLAEVGWLDHPVTRLTLQSYLGPLFAANPRLDTLVLGCTHYPVLKPAIAEVIAGLGLEQDVELVDSAEVTARDLGPHLRGEQGTGRRRFHVTDLPTRFEEVVATFWPGSTPEVHHVDITRPS